MTRPSTPPILAELRSSSSPAGQVAALRALKNEIIGHEQKKEMWIGLGVLAPIKRMLNSHKGSGKRKYCDGNGDLKQIKRRGNRTDEEEARLQAIIIVGSLAHACVHLGGPAYVHPLYAGGIVAPLLDVLSPLESPSAVLAALRTLNTVVDSLTLEYTRREAPNGLISCLYTDTHLKSITHLLSQTSSSLIVQQQISLTAALITKTCQDESQRGMLAQSGVLEALASRLASFVIATGCCLTPANAESDMPPPATMRSRMAPVLEAVGGIIQNSKIRAIQFLSAPAFVAVFPRAESDAASAYQKKVTAWDTYNSTSSGTRQTPPNLIETLLPQLPSSHQRSSPALASNYPPLGAIGTFGKQLQSTRNLSPALEPFEITEDDESPLVAWLIYVVRAEKCMIRLMAAWVLAILYRSGLTSRRRETGFALLLVPLLVRMLDKDLKISSELCDPYNASVFSNPDWAIKEQAPAVLAMLAVDSNELQRAAVDAGAIKKLSQLLKESYDPLPANYSASLWTPDGTSTDAVDTKDDASRLGASGLSPTAFHVIKMREAVLIALAALASLRDEFRKMIIDNGVVPFVIESLKPYSMAPVSHATTKAMADGSSKDQKVVNPRHVILAACGISRGLSRSVSTLRTDLMDAGLAAPLFALLRHSDIDIQVSATAVICNLVLEFSPMREAILEAGILTILCEHAHSMIAELRLNSIWALKHLVLGAPNALKMTCLEELGPGWLKQIISNDTDDFGFPSGLRGDREGGSRTPITMGTPNAAGEQVDLLNAVEDSSRESSQAVDDNGEDLTMVDSIGALSRPHPENKSTPLLGRQHDPRANEVETIKSPDIEREGLDLLRNILAGAGAAEMIDHIFREFGQDKLFELLANKLRPKVLNAFNRDRRSSENGVRQVQPPTKIIISVLYIIVHVAAGLPRHRQLLVSQSELLKLVVPLFSHPDSEVRCPCVWIVINASGHDNSADLPNSRSRARELVKLGFYEQLEAIEADPSLDVRERTRTALTQMAQLLRS